VGEAKRIKLLIDGREYEAEEGMTVLQVTMANGIPLPTLCYHKALKPIGACRLCAVEVVGRAGKPRILLACILRVREGLDVKTQTRQVIEARTAAFRNLLTMAPGSQFIRNLASEYEIDLGPPPDNCVRCRLCIRVCQEIVGAGALRMEKAEGRPLVVPTQGLCIGCGTCFNICPTGAIQMIDNEGVRTLSIRDEIIGIHALVRCEACGRFFASQNFMKHVEKRTLAHTEVKAHHQYCPTCAKLFSDRVKSSSKLRRMG
jgi:predicted molibdopterin-dependent oxidoreductase YjgC